MQVSNKTDKEFFRRERALIEHVLDAHGVKLLKVSHGIVSPSMVMYPIALRAGEKIRKVEGLVAELAVALSHRRKYAVKLRVAHPPLLIEVPHSHPASLPFSVSGGEPHVARLGRGYSFNGGVDVVHDFDAIPHALIAGITNSGKSVLTLAMAVSLAMSTSPDDLRYAVIDLKNEDLVPLADFPHTIGFANSEASAMQLLERVNAEMVRRRDSRGNRTPFRLVVWIDEIARLPKEGHDLVNAITALGRSIQVHIVSGTQHPTGEVLGGATGKVNYGARYVGKVADASASATATGLPRLGCEMLPGKGAFIANQAGDIVRFQAFLCEDTDVRQAVRYLKGMYNRVGWDSGSPIEVVGEPIYDEPELELELDEAADLTGDALDELYAIFDGYYDGDKGLQRGGIMAALRAYYGDEARSRGTLYAMQRDEVLELFAEWLDEMGYADEIDDEYEGGLGEIIDDEAVPVDAY